MEPAVGNELVFNFKQYIMTHSEKMLFIRGDLMLDAFGREITPLNVHRYPKNAQNRVKTPFHQFKHPTSRPC